jgi:hypothetical protein
VDGGSGVGGQVDLAAAQSGEPGAVGIAGRPQHVRRPADEHGAVGNDRAGRDEGALAENAAVAQPGAGHEDRAITDLAQVAHPGSDNRGPMAEDRALSNLDRMVRPADEHTVLQHRGVVAQRDAPGPGAQHHALREQSAGAEVRLSDQNGRGGDLEGGLLGLGTVETHPSTSPAR